MIMPCNSVTLITCCITLNIYPEAAAASAGFLAEAANHDGVEADHPALPFGESLAMAVLDACVLATVESSVGLAELRASLAFGTRK